MTPRLFTSKDVVLAFPWLSAWTLNARVAQGKSPCTQPSSRSGIPSLFTLTDLVQAGVVDEMAALGAPQKRVRVAGWRDGKPLVNPFDPNSTQNYYESRGFEVEVLMFVTHPNGRETEIRVHYLPDGTSHLQAAKSPQALISVYAIYTRACKALGVPIIKSTEEE